MIESRARHWRRNFVGLIMAEGRLRRWGCNIVALLFAALLAYLLIYRTATPWQTLAVCLLMAAGAGILGNIDTFDSIKGGPGGVEATIRRAEAATDRLLRLAEAVGEVLVEQMSAARFFGGADGPSRDRHKTMILDALKVVGVPPAKLAQVEAADRAYSLVEYSNTLLRNAGPKRNTPARAAFDQFWAPFSGSFERPAPAQVQSALEIAGALEPWRAELLADYRHYSETGKHRRPAVWAERDNWYDWTANGPWMPDPNRED